MKLFSNRNRPVHMGPFPLERLGRANGAAALGNHWPPQPVDKDDADARGLSNVVRGYLRRFEQLRDAEIAPEKAPIFGDPEARANELKASGYFLDASMMGVCEIPDGAWRVAPAARPKGADGQAHRYAVVLLVELPRRPEPGNLAHRWTEGSERDVAALRSAEIACVLAGYIRRMGYAARAHSRDETELLHAPLILAAGLGVREGDDIVNPFVGRSFETAIVSTELELTPDRPLKLQGALARAISVDLPAWFGIGGAKPGWERWRERRRASHLFTYPMERIKRVDRPTTLIIEDEVPRVPKRAAFFERALQGDLGEKSKKERTRFALKHPYAHAMTPLFRSMVPAQDGQVAPEKTPGLGDGEANAKAVKSLSYYLGVDLTGVCLAKRYAWYSHHADGRPIEPYHKYAIVMLIDQGYETMEGASGDDWISGAQSMRGYMRGAEIAGILAAHIRSLGYSARSHTNIDSDVLHIPLVLEAGLGELSRIGELVLNPYVGPRFKSVVVTTDLPLTPDRPIDFGLQDMCQKCMKCARECPCDAIAWGDKVMFNGYEMWKPDVERCTRYRLTNPHGSACGRCMKMCPYNHEGLLMHRAFLWAAIHLPFTRQWIAMLDDKVGNGRRNPVKKWWQDLELIGNVAKTPKGVNRRDLDLEKKLDPAKQKIAYYHASMMPPPNAKAPVAVDRKAALEAASVLETPVGARERHRQGGAKPAHYEPTPPVAE